jgi:hypothetical protein
MAIQMSSLRVVISSDIRREWRANASRYAWQWLVDMVSRGRHVVVDPNPEVIIRRALTNLSADNQRAVRKDLLLIEAALDTDKRVLSRDNAMRRILHSMAIDIVILQDVHWVGPEYPGCVEWLNQGAPTDPEIQLSRRL